MRVAVTGASGHIGSCLVRTLKEKGAEIKVLVHKQRSDLDKLGLEITEGDLLDIGSLDKLCNGAEAVFHLAAQITLDNRSDKKTYDVNVTGTRNILNAAKRRGVRKFIHFSSIHAFSPVPEDILLDELVNLEQFLRNSQIVSPINLDKKFHKTRGSHIPYGSLAGRGI